MSPMKFLVAACSYFLLLGALGAEVVSLSWDTKQAAPPLAIGGDAQKLLPAFRLGLQTLPESAIVTMALSQPALLGLTPAQSAAIAPLVAKRYELMANSPDFAKVPSLLPYCYSETRPTKGAACMFIPAGATAESPTILFLHGYGGSFLWYLHWMAEAFPSHIIIAPAYGISQYNTPATYLAECMAAASQRLGYELRKPALVGLSAGGPGACRAFLSAPDRFERLICLAAYPPGDTIRGFRRTQKVLFVAGSREPFVEQLRSSLKVIQTTCPTAEMKLIPDADHFFMLSHPDDTRKALTPALPVAPPASTKQNHRQ